MSRALPILIVAALAGCGDPSITVVFDVDDDYLARIDGGSSTLRIYHPVPAAPFDCEQLAFGQVDPEVLRLSLVSEISLAAKSEGPLEVDRAASKLFWADGIDPAERRLVTGCAEQGEITGDTEVVITAEPTKLVSVVSQPSLSVQMGAELAAPIEFEVTDLDERPLAGVEVRWEIDGAGGSGSNGAVTTSKDGRALILPQVPTRPGPFVLDVATRWAETDPAPVTGFVHPIPAVGTLPGRVYDYRGGPIGPNAEPGFAALIDGGPGAYKVAYVYQNSEGQLQTRISQDVITSAPQLGLIDPRDDGERARAFVVGIDDWTEIGIDGSLTPRTYTSPGLLPVAVEMSGSCEPGSPQQVFISYEADVIGIFNDQAQGALFQDFDLDLIASGCVTDEVAGDRRILILLDFDLGLIVGALVGEDLIGQYWLAINSGVGFARELGLGGDGLLLGTQLSGNDIIISRNVVRSADDTLRLVERDLDSPNGLPLSTDGGDIDGDGLLDVVSLLDARVTIDDPSRFTIFAALGKVRGGKRITADFEIASSAMLRDPEMILLDLDRDGSDDVVVGDRTGLEIIPPLETRFEIYEMGELTPE
jgi:hypothetical protein